jgi:phosphoribosyl 1,2-cyclic phosphodiesterase
MAVFVKFWGTRGSIPTPASWTRVYGGNTPCVEVRFGGSIFICDAGSGIRELGKDLLARRPSPKRLHLFISHTHWDHIQGFPFFEPVYTPDTEIHVYGRTGDANSPYQLLSGQMASEYFPVSFKDLGANIIDDNLNDEAKEIEGVVVRSFPLEHPGGCRGYSFEGQGRKIVYATDNELKPNPEYVFPDHDGSGPLRRAPDPLVEAARDADLLILDSQYDDKEYASKRNWGHSAFYSATDFAIQAGAKTLALFHHDPESTDRAVDEKVELCRKRASNHGADLIIMAAREGVELKF